MFKRQTAGHTAVSWHSVIARKFDDSYTRNVNFQERVRVWTALIDKYAKKDGAALDLGCGSGVFTFHLARACGAVTAVDGSPEMIRLCREKSVAESVTNLSFVNCDIAHAAKEIPQKFDLILCSSVMEYLDDVNGTLQTISGLLNPGGILIVSIPNRRSFFRKVEPYLHKYIGRPRYYKFVKNVLTWEDMTARIKAAGLDVIETHFYARTRILSPVFRRIGLRRFSDNLFALVCRKP